MEFLCPAPLHHVLRPWTEHHLDPHLDVGNQRWRMVVALQQGKVLPAGLSAGIEQFPLLAGIERQRCSFVARPTRQRAMDCLLRVA